MIKAVESDKLLQLLVDVESLLERACSPEAVSSLREVSEKLITILEIEEAEYEVIEDEGK